MRGEESALTRRHESFSKLCWVCIRYVVAKINNTIPCPQARCNVGHGGEQMSTQLGRMRNAMVAKRRNIHFAMQSDRGREGLKAVSQKEINPKEGP